MSSARKNGYRRGRGVVVPCPWKATLARSYSRSLVIKSPTGTGREPGERDARRLSNLRAAALTGRTERWFADDRGSGFDKTRNTSASLRGGRLARRACSSRRPRRAADPGNGRGTRRGFTRWRQDDVTVNKPATRIPIRRTSRPSLARR